MAIPSKVMEDVNNLHLWNKIKNFNFDQPGTTFTFSHKLARQKNWTPAFTEKVIEEYKKFIFLCCISSNGASPSLAVDEAWHLHLTYTQSYWQQLCKNVLGKELHHYPSKGGPEEKLKHEKWYKETLLLYEEVFDLAPDPDIWPRPKEPVDEIEEVNFCPARPKNRQSLLFFFFFVFIATSNGLIFPFSLTGLQFLLLYLILGIVVFFKTRSFLNERIEKIKGFVEAKFPGNASPLELVACLWGNERAIATSIVNLVNKGLLKVQEDERFIVQSPHLLRIQPGINSQSLIELRQGTKLSYKELVEKLYTNCDFKNGVLQKMETIVTSARTPVNPLVWAFFAIGFARLIRGLVLKHPIEYLVVEICLFSLLFLFLDAFNSSIDIYLGEIARVGRQKLKSFEQLDDKLLSDFATRGSEAITSLAAGALLTSLFITHTSFITTDQSAAEKKETSGSSCGGGGCGCGGCGGCGG